LAANPAIRRSGMGAILSQRIGTARVLYVRILLATVFLCYPGLCGSSRAQGPAPISDTTDIKNEIKLIGEKLGSIEKRQQEHFTVFSERAGSLERLGYFLFGGIGALIVLVTFLQGKTAERVERITDRSIEKSMAAAESRIDRAAEVALSRLEGKLGEPALEERLLRIVTERVGSSGSIKREVLSALVKYLQEEGVLTSDSASRIALSIANAK
jgi:hypothetical protein